MLSISTADNVISYKKLTKKRSKNQNRWFYNINSAPELRNDQKLPKTDHSIAIYSFFCIRLRATKTGSKDILISKSIFGILSAHRFRGYLPRKFSGTERFTKSSVFHRSPCPYPQKKYWARVPTILMPPTFPIAGLNRCTPKFQGGPKSRPGVIGLASSTLQNQPIQKVVHDFRCVIFWTK